MRSRLNLLVCLVVLAWVPGAVRAADATSLLYERASAAVYQILIVERDSKSKSSIGSGFQIDAGGLIATNFHVISQAVHKPERYSVHFLDSEGNEGELAIVDFDVVHDLALVRHAGAGGQFLPIAEAVPDRGQAIFALGNPFDLGQTIVGGTFNGLLEQSFYKRMLFSGSLNPGMSGGPALDADGNVVGINVATSGNQISFLVPVRYLSELLANRDETLVPESYRQRIEAQLTADSEYKYRLLLDREWPVQTLGEATIAGELTDYFKCWGDTMDDEKVLYDVTEANCSTQDSIYISQRFQTGAIDYQYSFVTTDELTDWRFQQRAGELYGAMYTRNPASRDDVTNYECNSNFVTSASDDRWRAVFCVRAYRDYEGLFDVLFMASLLGEPQRSLSSHFALSGVSRDNALAFAEKFMRLTRWGS